MRVKYRSIHVTFHVFESGPTTHLPDTDNSAAITELLDIAERIAFEQEKVRQLSLFNGSHLILNSDQLRGGGGRGENACIGLIPNATIRSSSWAFSLTQ